MDLHVDEQDGRVVLQSEDKQHTVMSLVRSTLWDTGVEAGYDKGHPYIGSSKLVFDSDAPLEDVTDAISRARDDVDAFRDAISE